jgi:hypothetical protein
LCFLAAASFARQAQRWYEAPGPANMMTVGTLEELWAVLRHVRARGELRWERARGLRDAPQPRLLAENSGAWRARSSCAHAPPLRAAPPGTRAATANKPRRAVPPRRGRARAPHAAVGMSRQKVLF